MNRHFKQIGLVLHNFHDVFNTFPPESVAKSVTGDLRRGEFRWPHELLESLKGQQARVRFTLQCAGVFAYWLED